MDSLVHEPNHGWSSPHGLRGDRSVAVDDHVQGRMIERVICWRRVTRSGRALRLRSATVWLVMATTGAALHRSWQRHQLLHIVNLHFQRCFVNFDWVMPARPRFLPPVLRLWIGVLLSWAVEQGDFPRCDDGLLKVYKLG